MTKTKKILIIGGDAMEDYEIFVPYQTLCAYGYGVDVICPGKKSGDKCMTVVHDFDGGAKVQTYTEKRGHNFELNGDFAAVKMCLDDYDGLLVPGGRAPEYLALDQEVLAIVKHFFDANKPVAAICHGIQILSAAKVLKGRTGTAYPACKPPMVQAGCTWIEPEPITMAHTDKNFVSSPAWPSHPEFLRQFTELLGCKVTGTENKKILALCGDYMEDLEIMVPFQALQSLGYTLDAVSPGKSSSDQCHTAVHDFEGHQTYTEKPGHLFNLNADFASVDVSAYAGLLIPGGRAPEHLSTNDDVIKMVKKFSEEGKIIASICHGQLILAAADVLKGKQCTAYPTLQPCLEDCGTNFVAADPIDKAVTDGNLVTACAWPGHPQFVAHFVAALGGKISI